MSAAVTGLSRLGLFTGWEARAVDAFVFLREQEPAPDIVLVTIDEDAFRELGERQPLSRRYLADLGEFLLRSGARVVGFDIVARTPTSADEDRALVETVQRWARNRPGAIVFASLLEPPRAGSAPGDALLPPFTGDLPALFGFASAPQGADGMVRRLMPLLPSHAGGFLPGFPLAVLAGAAGLSPAEFSRELGAPAGSITLSMRSAHGSVRSVEPVPVAQLATAWRVAYAGPPGTFTSFPSAPLVALARSGTTPDPDNPFRDKIVLVGTTFAESRDFYATPAGLMAGVEIQANMVHTLLGRRALLPPPWPLGMALLAALCVTVSVLSIWLRPLWLTLAGLALSGVLIATSWRAYARGYWLDFVAPLVAVLRYVQGSRMIARRRLRAAFGQYISPEVLVLSASLIVGASPAAAQSGETAGMITEIKPGRGGVEVRPAGAGDWRPGRPLLALHPGDVVRASEDATVIILFTGGRGSVRVDRAASPFTVPGAQAGEGKAQKARDLLQASLGYLAGGTRETSKAVLATRGAAPPPLVLVPRNSPVLPGPLVFEWLGTRFSRYTVTILGPDQVPALPPREVTGARWEYPGDGPALRPGVRYTVRVLSAGHSPQEAWFEIVDAARAQAIAADLLALEQGLGAGTPPSSVAVIRAGFLASEGFAHDARAVLGAALARDPDEPTLHLLLGDLQAPVGLSALAAQSYEEADYLLKR